MESESRWEPLVENGFRHHVSEPSIFQKVTYGVSFSPFDSLLHVLVCFFPMPLLETRFVASVKGIWARTSTGRWDLVGGSKLGGSRSRKQSNFRSQARAAPLEWTRLKVGNPKRCLVLLLVALEEKRKSTLQTSQGMLNYAFPGCTARHTHTHTRKSLAAAQISSFGRLCCGP